MTDRRRRDLFTRTAWWRAGGRAGLAARVCLALAVTMLVPTATSAASATARPAGAAASDSSPTRAQLQQLVDSVVSAGAPGASLLLRDGDHVVRVTSGVADVSTQQPLGPADTFRAGSVTKTFVATLVLQLVQRGAVRLDATVDRYLPGLLPAGDVITVRQLLRHTSGLPDYTADADFTAALLAGQDFTPRELVAFATRHPLLFRPGGGYAYSNTGYVVLGLLVRQAGDASLVTQLEKRILRPLGLARTTFPVYRREISRSHASGYISAGAGEPLQDVTSYLSPSWAWSAGALLSTTTDLAHFYRALLSGRLLPPRLLAEMQETVPAGPGLRYGLGIGRFALPCGATWGHDGLYPGYYDVALSSRDGRRQLVLMMNVDPLNGIPPTQVAAAFTTALASAYCGGDRARGTAMSGPPGPQGTLRTAVDTVPALGGRGPQIP